MPLKLIKYKISQNMRNLSDYECVRLFVCLFCCKESHFKISKLKVFTEPRKDSTYKCRKRITITVID